MMPLYDALEKILPKSKIKKYMEDKTIEISPLAYMRGRNFDDGTIVIGDEMQNSTVLQMHMFLTRLCKGGKIIITGDESQIDLPKSIQSGLVFCKNNLNKIEGIKIIEFTEIDNMRHPIITTINKIFSNQ